MRIYCVFILSTGLVVVIYRVRAIEVFFTMCLCSMVVDGMTKAWAQCFTSLQWRLGRGRTTFFALTGCSLKTDFQIFKIIADCMPKTNLCLKLLSKSECVDLQPCVD